MEGPQGEEDDSDRDGPEGQRGPRREAPRRNEPPRPAGTKRKGHEGRGHEEDREPAPREPGGAGHGRERIGLAAGHPDAGQPRGMGIRAEKGLEEDPVGVPLLRVRVVVKEDGGAREEKVPVPWIPGLEEDHPGLLGGRPGSLERRVVEFPRGKIEHAHVLRCRGDHLRFASGCGDPGGIHPDRADGAHDEGAGVGPEEALRVEEARQDAELERRGDGGVETGPCAPGDGLLVLVEDEERFEIHPEGAQEGLPVGGARDGPVADARVGPPRVLDRVGAAGDDRGPARGEEPLELPRVLGGQPGRRDPEEEVCFAGMRGSVSRCTEMTRRSWRARSCPR